MKISGYRLTVVLFAMVLISGGSALLLVFKTRIRMDGEMAQIFIREGEGYQEIYTQIDSLAEIKHPAIFRLIAEKKRYPSLIKPGRYTLADGMTYVEVINMLRSGMQSPVKVTFNNIRNINQLAGKVGGQIEADSSEIASFLSDPSNFIKDGFTAETVIAVFIPDTYEFYWNTSAEGFYNRMLKEYRKFWNGERLKKASSMNLSPVEVAILASIVDDEVLKQEEKPVIAGVYLNRLKRGMPLQACPTIKFALNDFTITRVLNKHLKIDSPYNTYRYKGLPPGPIGCPTIEGLESVLNAGRHEYLYFAARADFSGYHNFSRTLSEHNRYADQYQRELDRRRIYK